MSTRPLRFLALIGIFVIAGSSSEGGTIYVNNVIGDDYANGLFAELGGPGDGPVATIARALKIAQGSDSISIANTGISYSESVTLDRPDLAGTEAYPIIIEGNGSLMRGARGLPTSVWQRVGEGTYRYQPYRKGHYQLLVNGAAAPEAPGTSDEGIPVLEPMEWRARHGFVYFRVEPKKLIHEYGIEAPLFDVGFGFHNARNVVLRNLNVEAYRLDGIAVTGNSRNIRLVNIRSTANGRAGLSVSGTSQVQIGSLDLAGNRQADELVLLKGRISDLPEARVPPKPPAPADVQ